MGSLKVWVSKDRYESVPQKGCSLLDKLFSNNDTIARSVLSPEKVGDYSQLWWSISEQIRGHLSVQNPEHRYYKFIERTDAQSVYDALDSDEYKEWERLGDVVLITSDDFFKATYVQMVFKKEGSPYELKEDILEEYTTMLTNFRLYNIQTRIISGDYHHLLTPPLTAGINGMISGLSFFDAVDQTEHRMRDLPQLVNWL